MNLFEIPCIVLSVVLFSACCVSGFIVFAWKDEATQLFLHSQTKSEFCILWVRYCGSSISYVWGYETNHQAVKPVNQCHKPHSHTLVHFIHAPFLLDSSLLLKGRLESPLTFWVWWSSPLSIFTNNLIIYILMPIFNLGSFWLLKMIDLLLVYVS